MKRNNEIRKRNLKMFLSILENIYSVIIYKVAYGNRM